jgi:hypothetical protein
MRQERFSEEQILTEVVFTAGMGLRRTTALGALPSVAACRRRSGNGSNTGRTALTVATARVASKQTPTRYCR